MKTTLLAIALATAAITSTAGELIVHVGSKHSVSHYTLDEVQEVKINNSNSGIGYRNDDGLAVGTYYNSYHKQTYYVTQDFMYNKYVGVVVGLVSGYEGSTGLMITPMAAATVKVPLTEKITANFLAMPKFGKLAGVVHLAVSYKF